MYSVLYISSRNFIENKYSFREGEHTTSNSFLFNHLVILLSSIHQLFFTRKSNEFPSLGTVVDLRTNFHIYTRSTSAHEALRGFGIVQLPSVSNLKSSTGFNLEKAGFSVLRSNLLWKVMPRCMHHHNWHLPNSTTAAESKHCQT